VILIGVASLLGVAAIAVCSIQAYRAQSALDRTQIRTHGEASLVLEQRQRLLTRLEPLTALSRLERSPTAAAILTDVTTRVPGDTWLSSFELKGLSLRLIGSSPDAGAVVRQLANSGTLTDVELRNSTSAGAGSGRDRFEIVAQIKGAGT
jgi:Tfp pilus assembly protein PilN